MSTWQYAMYNAAGYTAARPTYPRALTDLVLAYHARGPAALTALRRSASPVKTFAELERVIDAEVIEAEAAKAAHARWDVAVDLGCGTGQATGTMRPFRRVVGVDPSAGMLKEARKNVEERTFDSELKGASPSAFAEAHDPPTTFDFVQSAAERLPFLSDASVDLVISAQAAHWFDWRALWAELARVVRPGGTVAFWGYSEMRLTQHPALTPRISAYVQGTLGPHWEQPGRSIVDDHLQRVPAADAVVPGQWADESRLYFTGPHHPTLPPPHLPVALRTRTTWAGFEAYLRTFSALHTFARVHGQAAADEAMYGFLTDLRAAVDAERQSAPAPAPASDGDHGVERERGGDVDPESLDVEWPVALVLAKRA